ncbi:MAG TPA: hypothetical protein VFX61_21365 [Micromonosporaceae bacterium]|nr:hypothetical protein [Micromonosporaceae bacterium]
MIHDPGTRPARFGNATVKYWIRLAAAVALVLYAVVAVLKVQRDREWAHGGDDVKVHVEVALTTEDTFEDVVVRLGAPPGETTRYIGAEQTIVVQASWTDSPYDSGWFQLLVLDKRVVPPRPLAVDGGWNANGPTGSNWASAYEVLAEQYEWLRGVSSANFTDASGVSTFRTAAVDAPATTAGTMTAWFWQWGDGQIPLAEVTTEVMVVLFYVDDSGEVRWARRSLG